MVHESSSWPIPPFTTGRDFNPVPGPPSSSVERAQAHVHGGRLDEGELPCASKRSGVRLKAKPSPPWDPLRTNAHSCPKMRIKKDAIKLSRNSRGGTKYRKGRAYESLCKGLAPVVIAAGVFLSPVAANAHERVTDAALGGLAGAVVFGPVVGLVAGGVIGYTAGPHIACKIGAKRCYRRDTTSVITSSQVTAEIASTTDSLFGRTFPITAREQHARPWRLRAQPPGDQASSRAYHQHKPMQ